MSNDEDQRLDDKSSFGGRLKRYAKVSTAMGRLATKLAGEKYLGVGIEREVHAEELKEILGSLKGPLMKVAQLLATIPEALPPEYVMELQQLQANAPSMGWPFVKRRMRTELGADWKTKFKRFDRDAIAAASLGQVHQAELEDGQLIACKLQYPDMESAVEADLKQLNFILSIFEKYDRAISTEHIKGEIADRLYEELDYIREAKHCRLYNEMLKTEATIHVPKVIDSISTDRLICSTWLQGQPIMGFKEAPLEQRNEIALNLFKAWYVPLYYYGVIHGDPHPGNYTVRDDLGINLLDFGCVRVFPPKFVHGVLELYQSLLHDDEERAVEAYKSWGFENMSKELIDVLNVWARFLYAPVLDDQVRTIGEIKGGVYGREIATKVHQELKKVGGVKVPREFVFMDRAALGLGSIFLHLQAEVNWYQVFQELTQGFDLNQLEQKQNNILKEFKILSS